MSPDEQVVETATEEALDRLSAGYQHKLGVDQTLPVVEAASYIQELGEILEQHQVGLMAYAPYMEFERTMEEINGAFLKEATACGWAPAPAPANLLPQKPVAGAEELAGRLDRIIAELDPLLAPAKIEELRAISAGIRGLSEVGAPAAPAMAQPAEAGGQAGSVWLRPADGMEMVWVPAGEFQMGSTPDEIESALEQCNRERGDCQRSWFEAEGPAHTVALDGFWLDRTEVTNAQYQRCVAAGACDKSEYADEPRWYGDDQPVVGVDWDDARTYCEWAGSRLPTEAEWEYAARGPEGQVYPWGDTLAEGRANIEGEGDGYMYTAPVGAFPEGASWVGALDLAGNVWEWTADWFHGEYPAGRQRNPTGPVSGEYRVLRGGSWRDTSYFARGAYRVGYSPGRRIDDLGFRCARNP